jgi:serine/threonine protein kinase
MLLALELLHLCGSLHHDLKPSGFLIRANRRYSVPLIDHGLSYIFTDGQTGEPLRARERP